MKKLRSRCCRLLVLGMVGIVGPFAYFEGGGEVDPYCRENPGDCEGEIGGDCRDDLDCFDGTCCKDKNCGDGMCTYLCNSDGECPSNMRCEHDTCFFECGSDADCGPGQKCEHGKTICEYEGGD